MNNIPGVQQVWSSIPSHGVDITPSDGSAIGFVTMGLWVGTGGDVRVRWASGSDMTYNNVPDGGYLSGQFTHVLATGTSATQIKAVR